MLDFVIIGSGFGGSVAALRLSQKGYAVSVLEAGRRWQTSDFPRSNWDARRYLWAPMLGCTGPQRMQLTRHALVLGGVGVGGGSLIYGNTLYEPGPEFFDHPDIQAIGGAESLRPCFDRAREMMGVVDNPMLTPMDHALREAASELDTSDRFRPSPVGVFFGQPGVEVPDPYFNGRGPPRTGCTGCGGCFIGCRIGAKNTLDRNYLHLAEQHGCRVRSSCRVTRIEPLSPDGEDGYRIHTRPGPGGEPTPPIETRGVVVAAGVVGTLQILLNAQRSDLPRLSSSLGRGVRTNGETVLAVRSRDSEQDHSKGLAASSSVWIDSQTQVQADRYPAGSNAMTWMSTLMVDGGGWIPRWLKLFGVLLRHPLDFLRSLWPGQWARQTAFLVVMQSRESRLRIRLTRSWLPPFRRCLQTYADGPPPPRWISQGNAFARRLAKRVGGYPLSSLNEVLLGRPVTAHILGGCPVGDSIEDSVIDRNHQVHGYANLYICDGTVVPANLGVNPALSILALSERAMDQIPDQSD
jgi:cholesterol oxidase